MFENAKWIAKNVWINWNFPGIDDMPPSPYLAKTFELKEKPQKAILNVCALGQGAYYFNGERIPDSYIPTHPSNYYKTVVYTSYDITDMTLVGKNRLGIMIGNNKYADQRAGFLLSYPKMICQLDITFADGTKECIVSDSSFKSADSHVLFSYARCGEIQDANKIIHGWCSPDFDDSDWNNAKIAQGPGGNLRPTDCPPRRVKAVLPCSEIAKGLFDCGINTAGVANIKIKGKKGASVQVLFSEDISKDGNHAAMLFGSDPRDYKERKHRATYILSGGDDEFEDLFSYHGFRYVEVLGEYEEILVTVKTVYTDIAVTSSFVCDNEIINGIHNMCVNSILTNCQVAMVDCPQREQNEWTGDGMLTAQTVAMGFDSYEMYYEWMLKFQDDQMPDGKLPCIVPAVSAGDMNYGNGMDWSSAIIHIPYYSYKYSGNIKIVKTMWDNMVRTMNFFKKTSDTNLLDGGLGDWAAYNRSFCPTEITDSAYYRVNALMMAEMAEKLGVDGAYYRTLAEDIKADFRAKYVKNGCVDDHHITAIFASVYAGFLDEDEIKPELARAIKIIKEDEGGNISCGVHGNRMMFDTLTKYGFVQEFFDILTNTEVPGYAKLVADGYTTIPESFDYNSHENSRNHQFKAMIDSWLFIYLAGINPQGFGFEDVIIEPYFVKGINTLKATSCGITVGYDNNKIEIDCPYDFTFKYNGEEKKFTAGKYNFKR